MKKIKIVITYLNLYRLIFPAIIMMADSNIRNILFKDSERLNINLGRYMTILYGIIWNKPFRDIVSFRLKSHKISYLLFKILFPSKTNLEVSGEIKEGFMIFHGQSSVIHCTSAGKNFSVYQNVTVGRNKDHYFNFFIDKPIIGDNVSLYPGSVVAGGITIGNNVEIAANTVVLKDVPDDCLVAGNPAYIIKRDGKKLNIRL